MNTGTVDPVVIAIAAAILGLLIGYFAGRRTAPGSEEARELTEKLEQAESARARYEQRVNAHFADSADKLNTLTANYRDIYAHIAGGASELCSEEEAARFQSLEAPKDSGHDTIEADSVVVEPPRDYAAKTSPDDPGVLDERFGLDGEEKPPEDSTTRNA
ncbi:YhcB family protein [Congregibacter sp.]|uniref:YhcB family protein n=1 Tax=Congregibacter sp. TaxID=2744308 RepID=UPI003F6CA08E